MHDPLVVAHVIVRPWPQRSTFPATGSRGDGVRWQIRHKHPVHDGCPTADCAGPGAFPWWKPQSYSRFWRLAGRDWYWPALLTVWHREPGGRDSGDTCRHTRRIFNEAERKWEYRTVRSWRWHVHHWRIQVHPAQSLRRRLLTRCDWCGGRQAKNDPVNVGHSWDGEKAHWWQGERGLFHHDCSSVEHVSRMCLCAVPVTTTGYGGSCLACGKFRPHFSQPDEADRLLASLPHGSRITPELRPRIDALWAERRARKQQAESAAREADF